MSQPTHEITSIIARMHSDLTLLSGLLQPPAPDGGSGRAATGAASQREACHPGPTTVEQIAADFDALRGWFSNQGHFIGQDVLHCVAIHHPAARLIALGFIEPGKLGRWLYGYVPAGELLEQLNIITP